MDPDVARMMRDLGIDRRDYVSAPAPPGAAEVQSAEQQAILAETELRRDSFKRTGAVLDPAVQRWHTEETFRADDVAGNLVNRFSGQGHRHSLHDKVRGSGRGYDRESEMLEVRVGEERMLWLQEQQQRNLGPHDNYVATTSPQRGGGAFSISSRGGHASGGGGTIPRSVPTGPSGDRNYGRDHAGPSGPPNRNRAVSPRSFGTVRFGRDGVRIDQPAATAPVNGSEGIPLTQNGTPPHLRRFATPPAASNANTAAPRSASAQSFASPMSTTAGNTAPVKVEHDWNTEQRYKLLAIDWATRPGAERDQYYAKYPDRKQYLRPMQIQLMKEVLVCAMNPQSGETALYRERYPNREWMYQAAVQAADFVQNHTEAEGNAYYEKHPELADFLVGAKRCYKPQVKAAAPDTATVMPTMASNTTASVEHAKPASASGPGAQLNTTAAPLLPSAVHSTVQSSHTTTPLHQPFTAKQPSTLKSPTPQQQHPSAPEDTSDTSSDLIDCSDPLQIASGWLTATFHDTIGRLKQTMTVPVDLPVQFNATITSRDANFDPRGLVAAMEDLGRKMTEISRGDAQKLRTGGTGHDQLVGVRLAEDGIWEEL